MALRLGVFGGTFDPPHVGHLVAAVNARHDLRLDRVLLVVANEPWQKVKEHERPGQAVSGAEDRLAMTAAAVAGIDGLEVSDIEIGRGGPTYTVDTLIDLRRRHPDVELFLILGGDAAANLPTWERAPDVPGLATIVVVRRPGADHPLPAGAVAVDMPLLAVSSTDLRDRVASGRPLDFLVPPGVVSVIAERGLYRGGSL